MRLVIVAVGQLKQGPERELARRFQDRVANSGRAVGLRPLDVIEIGEARAREATERIKLEGEKIAAAVPPDAAVIVLDERGEACSSEAFAGRIGRFRDEGKAALAFVVGGPDGLARDVGKRADWIVAFGKMTFPHQLIRIMLLEQIYRAMTILSGHPYHRA